MPRKIHKIAHKIVWRHAFRRFAGVIVLALGLPFFWTCDDQKKDTPPKAASTKVGIAKSASSDPVKSSAVSVGKAASSETIKTSVANPPKAKDVAKTRIYNPNEQPDPFVPLFKATETPQASSDRNTAGRIKGPLEKISLNLLKLVAIVRAPSGDRALVEDRTGKGYIIKKGTYIGSNSGVVTKITKNSILIREASKNLAGEAVSRDIELTLRKPAGGE
ncbi:pilus assembly protein PilP [Desulfosarcina sp. OttesenSCG-928-G17]|nr:pilus assembly protein PilP [Desulfosarcina sp. OttesenSCG-928-G17]